VGRKQVFGSDGTVAGMGCQTFALWVGCIFFVFSIIGLFVVEDFFRLVANGTCMKSCRLRGDSLSRYNALAAENNL
jgi:hypothetical protein